MPSAPANRAPARPSGYGQPDRRERLAQRCGPSSPRGCQPEDLLGERTRRAAGVVAEEPMHLQHDLDRAATDRRIGQVSPIAATHPSGGLSAPDTQCGIGADPGRQPYATGPVPDILEHDVVEVRQQPRNKIT
ncbi:MAG: hypothetical protein ACRDS9_12005 [Pseudonocardiaceae bacterium]